MIALLLLLVTGDASAQPCHRVCAEPAHGQCMTNAKAIVEYTKDTVLPSLETREALLPILITQCGIERGCREFDSCGGRHCRTECSDHNGRGP